MTECSVGGVYTHVEDGFTVTVTEIKKKTLGTSGKPIVKTLISFVKNEDGTKMMTEQAVFLSRYQAV